MAITRSEVLQRAQTVWPMGRVPYSQTRIHQPDGYRQDCSGYVSMCWAIPLTAPGSWGGMNTVSLVTDGWMHEIKPGDIKPGDAIGRCGPGTAGNVGHVQLFTGWLTTTDHSDSHYYCLEQTGGGAGPNKRLHDWPSGYRAYRFKDIADSEDDMATKEQTANLLQEGWAILTGANAGIIAFETPGGKPQDIGNPLWALLRSIAGRLDQLEAKLGDPVDEDALADQLVERLQPLAPGATPEQIREILAGVRLTTGS